MGVISEVCHFKKYSTNQIMRDQVRRHGSAAIFGRGLLMITGIAMTIVLARVLEPRSFSDFAIFRTAVTLLALAVSGGFGTVAIRFLGESRSSNRYTAAMVRNIFRPIAILSLASSVLIAIAIVIVLPFVSGELFDSFRYTFLLVAFIAGTIGMGLTQNLTDFARGIENPGIAAFYGGVRGMPIGNILFFTLLSLAMWLGLTDWPVPVDWSFAASLYGLSLLFAAVLALTKLRRVMNRDQINKAELPVKSDAPSEYQIDTWKILEIASPIAIAALLMALTTQGDFFLTAWFSEPDDVTAYVASRRWTLLVAMPLAALNITTGGLIAPQNTKAEKLELELFIRAGTTLISAPAIAVCLAAIFAPILCLTVVLGAGYETAAATLPILVIGQIAIITTGPCGLILSLKGFERLSLYLAIVSFLVLICLGPLVASLYGATGLAWCTTTLFVSISAVNWWLCWRLTGINTLFDPRLIYQPKLFARRLHLNRSAS